jgi:hypothetical protein
MSDTYRLQYSYYPEGTGTDIVPLAAIYSGSNYFYNKNFGTLTATTSNNTWNIPFGSNISVTDANKLSFQLGGDCGTAFCGGVYGYESKTGCKIDFSRNAYRRGVVMFGPRSYFNGPDSALPQIVALIGNYSNGNYSASEIQIGGNFTNQNHFQFSTPLTSNLYGVYGFNRSVDNGNARGGAIIRSYSLNASGFDCNCFSPSGQYNITAGNIQMVVVQ